MNPMLQAIAMYNPFGLFIKYFNHFLVDPWNEGISDDAEYIHEACIGSPSSKFSDGNH